MATVSSFVLGTVLAFLACCRLGNGEFAPDVIVVGVGSAGGSILRDLVPKFPHLNFAAFDAGTFVSSRFGATEPVSDAFRRSNLTSIDVPGEYNNLAYVAGIDATFQLPDAPWAFLGRAVGGNSNFNGALIQVPGAESFSSWPTGWQYADLESHFAKVLRACNVTTTPSHDLRHYANGSVALLNQVAASLNATANSSTFMPSGGTSVYTSPNVAVTHDGLRCFGTEALLELVNASGVSVYPNLKFFLEQRVSRVLVDASGTALGVEYYDDQNNHVNPHPPSPNSLMLRNASYGRVVLTAGAVLTPKVLFHSGIGPQSLHNYVYPSGPSFAIDNEGIGVRLADHVGAAVVISCASYAGYQSYSYNAADVDMFTVNRTGPYAQYGPVWYLYNSSSRVEVFSNPWGLGTPKQQPPNQPWNNAHTFTLMAVAFDPMPRSYIVLTANDTVQYPMLYNNAADMMALAEALSSVVATLLEQEPSCSVAFGPGAEPWGWMKPANVTDMFNYVNAWGPFDDYVWWSHLGLNHFVGSAPLFEGGGFGVNPADVRVQGTTNLHVADASIIPNPVWAHPLATILAVASKAGDLLADLLLQIKET